MASMDMLAEVEADPTEKTAEKAPGSYVSAEYPLPVFVLLIAFIVDLN